MAALRRKPRKPFPYVLEQDKALPVEQQPRFIIQPPTGPAWAEMIDGTSGNAGALYGAVTEFIERLENHPDAAEFGTAGSEQRRRYVADVMGFAEVRELGNNVSLTMLTETDRKNSDSPSDSAPQTGGGVAAVS